jgi:acetyl-CoA synthetase
VNKYDLSSIKLLGSVGEPINEEAWQWYYKTVGKENAPIVDTWWQTETGGIMISGIGGHSPMKPAHAGYPLPGIQPCLMTADGKEVEGNDVEGLLCIKFPWPSMLRTTYGDHERCRQTYFSAFEDKYFTGDGARRDADGMYRIIGRVENAINEHPRVIESAVVGYPHDIKGQGIYAYVIVNGDITDEEAFKKEVLQVVTKEIGPIAKPDKIQLVSGLPKTRSGKIMRRILRKIASGDTSNLGDISTLLNPDVVEEIKDTALV